MNFINEEHKKAERLSQQALDEQPEVTVEEAVAKIHKNMASEPNK